MVRLILEQAVHVGVEAERTFKHLNLWLNLLDPIFDAVDNCFNELVQVLGPIVLLVYEQDHILLELILSVENVFLDDEVFEVASLLLHSRQAPHEDADGERLQFDVFGRLAVLIKHHVGHPLRVLTHVV